eukprot:TRINITY_DN6604_c0_g1_i1.p1 TRINITY_DN6604_c0_g1~~TRINITY_DN6604_c0_g1_i1.p1  ORF type:complete len:254 (-),score=37.10 TRINITY_DN6604_c0_g1_i1:89-823(-)
MYYCSKKCQADDWKRHRKECKVARKPSPEDSFDYNRENVEIKVHDVKGRELVAKKAFGVGSSVLLAKTAAIHFRQPHCACGKFASTQCEKLCGARYCSDKCRDELKVLHKTECKALENLEKFEFEEVDVASEVSETVLDKDSAKLIVRYLNNRFLRNQGSEKSAIDEAFDLLMGHTEKLKGDHILMRTVERFWEHVIKKTPLAYSLGDKPIEQVSQPCFVMVSFISTKFLSFCNYDILLCIFIN